MTDIAAPKPHREEWLIVKVFMAPNGELTAEAHVCGVVAGRFAMPRELTEDRDRRGDVMELASRAYDAGAAFIRANPRYDASLAEMSAQAPDDRQLARLTDALSDAATEIQVRHSGQHHVIGSWTPNQNDPAARSVIAQAILATAQTHAAAYCAIGGLHLAGFGPIAHELDEVDIGNGNDDERWMEDNEDGLDLGESLGYAFRCAMEEP